MQFLKLPISYSQNTLYVRMMRQLHEFPTTWVKTGILPFLNLMVGGGLCYLLLTRSQELAKRVISLFYFIVAGFAYILVRYIFMILIFIYLMYFVGYGEDVSMVYIFWHPIAISISFLIFPILISKVLPLRPEVVDIREKFSLPILRRYIRATVFVCFGVFLILASIGFHDPGREKQGRLLMDEKHSNWEISTKKYDTNWYGQLSGYNYYCMAEYLNHYYHLDRNFDVITPELLDKYDVLILKIPTSPFSGSEVDAIIQFVKNGGGLYLLGEHTNVFGSSAFLNPIAENFKFSFRYDVIFDIETKFVQLYIPPELMPHPIVQHMPPFLFETSCSIEPYSYLIERVILENGLKSLDIDYHSSNFYPQVQDAANMKFGPFIQMVAVKSGKGRVAAFTDSTVFSNFSAFNPGKAELLLCSVDWLNRANNLRWLNILFFIMGLVSFAVAGLILRRRKKRFEQLDEEDYEIKRPLNLGLLSINVAISVCIIAISVLLFTFSTEKLYPMPEPHTQPVRIYFEKEHSEYQFPLTGHVEENTKAYEIFYQWVLRLGYYPSIGRDFTDSMKQGDMVVVINPQGKFTIEELGSAKEYVSQGGKLLLMDTPHNQDSSANSLLQVFGLEIDKLNQTRPYIIQDSSGMNSWNLGYDVDANPISGGNPILVSQDGQPVLSTVKIGKGTVTVLTFSDRFVDARMGVVERVVPKEDLRRIFELQFDIFRGIINDDLESELSQNPEATETAQ
jgi:hypothetical protein